MTGTVQVSGTGTNVPGAHVFLRDAIRGALGPSAVSRANGQFTIAGVPVGIYTLHVEPIDGPMSTTSLSAGGWTGVVFNTTFRATTLGGATPTVLAVKSSVTTAAGTISVTGSAPTMNPTAVFPMATATGGFSFSTGEAFATAPPYTAWLGIVGTGFNALADGAFGFDSPFLTITGQVVAFGVGTFGVGLSQPFTLVTTP